MPSTDVDGSPIVILNEAEARKVYCLLTIIRQERRLTTVERKIVNKIARDLSLPSLEPSHEQDT